MLKEKSGQGGVERMNCVLFVIYYLLFGNLSKWMNEGRVGWLVLCVLCVSDFMTHDTLSLLEIMPSNLFSSL